jgi:general secretion pathway protein D
MALLNHQRPLWALLAAAPLLRQSVPVQAQTWKINLRDADLTAFINEVADITGKTLRLILVYVVTSRLFQISL